MNVNLMIMQAVAEHIDSHDEYETLMVFNSGYICLFTRPRIDIGIITIDDASARLMSNYYPALVIEYADPGFLDKIMAHIAYMARAATVRYDCDHK